ncbi:MAG: hypothetical protein ACLFWD_04310 [Anaerolineales bacterium]
METLRHLIRRLGAARVTVLAGLISIVLSVALTALMDLLLKGDLVRTDLVLGFFIPPLCGADSRIQFCSSQPAP